MVDAVRLGVIDDPVGRMPDRDLELPAQARRHLPARAMLREVRLEMLARPLDDRLGLDLVRPVPADAPPPGRATRHRISRQASSQTRTPARQAPSRRSPPGSASWLHLRRRRCSWIGADRRSAGRASASRWRGRKNALAISVGTTALPMTAATRKRILRLVDDAVGQPEQRGNAAEREAGRHQQRRVHGLPPRRREGTRHRIYTDDLGRHLRRQQQQEKPSAPRPAPDTDTNEPARMK